MITSRFYYALIINVLLIALVSISCNYGDQKRFQLMKNSLTKDIGKPFKIENVIDSSGKPIKLDFSKSDLTIIDFWFKDCPPCIEEMQRFPKILAGREGKISIISISINQFWVWKPILTHPTGKFSFLNNSTTNWKQYDLKTSQDKKLKNEYSVDRLDEIQSNYSIPFFPSYFVVNKKGIIISRPQSALAFIKAY